jgi:hypothetical protein
MATEIIAWKSHVWSNGIMDLQSDVPVVQQVCTICGRSFVTEELTGGRYAVHVGIENVERLSDEVSARWLSEVAKIGASKMTTKI